MSIGVSPTIASSRVADVAVDRGRARVPVVQVEDVDRPAVRTERLERGATEQPEAPRVVRVVARPRPRRTPRGRRPPDGRPGAAGSRRPARRGRSPRCSPIGAAHPARAGPSTARRSAARARPGSAAGRPRPAAPRRRRRAGRAPAPGRRPRPPGRRSWPTARTRRRASRRATAWPASYAPPGSSDGRRRSFAGAN